MFGTNETRRSAAANVTFEPGAGTAWHTHPLGLTLIVTSGCGWVHFYNLINEMRVEEAKKLLLSEKIKYSDMIGIAIEAGFNSKTTFNTTFKS